MKVQGRDALRSADPGGEEHRMTRARRGSLRVFQAPIFFGGKNEI